ELALGAVASRDPARAAALAGRFGFARSFGSYLELAEDPATDLVYVATPNTFHAEHARLCLEHGKHVLCEKPFTANAREAESVLALAAERGLFCGEAMWMRFLPASRAIGETLRAGRIGEPRMIEAVFEVPVSDKARIREPALGGGALLDLGVYPLAFALLHFGTDYTDVTGRATLLPTGVDDQAAFSLAWANGRIAALACSATAAGGADGRIVGTTGCIDVPLLVRCEGFRISPFGGGAPEDVACPFECNGYEYELRAAARAVENGLAECPEAPHEATLAAMRAMDALRAAWGVRFPCDAR
ncbi:MAG: Gfo/Idh/MocA family oxidoreductase, partial [Kiritimatiellae bacterium]|nr:Gfo/Idh/MocA family oxidoreductase [Kiritimatiellia bacterium]